MDSLELVNSAIAALIFGHSLQSKIRDRISSDLAISGSNKHTAETIANDMADFKREAEEYISKQPGTEVKSLRKKTNNIINDVSRICRSEIGYSIRCTHKKGGCYVYQPQPYIPKPLSSVSPVAKSVAVDPRDAVIADLRQKVKNLEEALLDAKSHVVKAISHTILNHPEEVLGDMVRMHGKEKTGRMTVDTLKNVDTAVE